MSKPGMGQLIAGAGGMLLIVSLFLPWADVQDVSQSGWEFLTISDVFFLIAGLIAIAAAITGGRHAFMRPDLSLNAATDLLGVVSTLLLAWLLLFDLPAGASTDTGAFLALIAAIAIMGGAGDYSVLRRSSRADPTIPDDARQAR